MQNDPLIDSALFHHLTSEIGKLTDEQVEALRRATFLGMTEEEERNYDNRDKHLAGLVHELRVLMSNRTI